MQYKTVGRLVSMKVNVILSDLVTFPQHFSHTVDTEKF